MRIAACHSHLNGFEWINYHRPNLWEEINDVVSSVDAEEHRTKRSQEKRMKGKMLFSPTGLNASIKQRFSRFGWESETATNWVTDDYNLLTQTKELDPVEQKTTIESAGHRAIYSYNQTDFVKQRVAIEVQFGKYSFISYDIFVKHPAFYGSNQIDLGIEIVPTKTMQSEMSSGPGYYEAALSYLARQGRGVPSVPLILLGLAA